jgi:hypothetical protein
VVENACNPSYSGGESRKIESSRPVGASKTKYILLKIWGIAQ